MHFGIDYLIFYSTGGVNTIVPKMFPHFIVLVMENTVFSPKTPTVVQLSRDLVTLKATACDSCNIFLIIKRYCHCGRDHWHQDRNVLLDKGDYSEFWVFFFNVPLVCMQAIIERATSLQRKNYPNRDEVLFHSG